VSVNPGRNASCANPDMTGSAVGEIVADAEVDTAEIVDHGPPGQLSERDQRFLRDVLGSFATGVTVITTASLSGFAGFTVNSFTSVSLCPPLVLFCADRNSATAATIDQTKSFAVNILGRDQEDISRRFCESLRDRFEGVEVIKATTGAPILREALAYLDCELAGSVYAGDHQIFVGQVRSAAQLSDKDPLLFFQGDYC